MKGKIMAKIKKKRIACTQLIHETLFCLGVEYYRSRGVDRSTKTLGQLAEKGLETLLKYYLLNYTAKSIGLDVDPADDTNDILQAVNDHQLRMGLQRLDKMFQDISL